MGPNGSAYGSSTSPGFGAAWTQEVEDPSSGRWALSANYTSKDGASSSQIKGYLVRIQEVSSCLNLNMAHLVGKSLDQLV